MKTPKAFISISASLFLSSFVLSCVSKEKSAQEAPTAATVQLLRLDNAPVLGKTKSGQEIKLGGFSGLYFVKKENDQYHFLSLTDRGPNAEEIEQGPKKKIRPFLLPEFSPQLIALHTDLANNQIVVDSQRAFLDSKGNGLTGFPPSVSAVGSEKKIETPSDIYGKVLKNVKAGVDPEGFCVFKNTYMISEEYGPDVLQFDQATLKQIKRFSAGKGLPAEYALRKTNRGLEGLTCDETHAYLFLQSPLKKTEKEIDQNHIRLAKLNPVTSQTEKEYFYPVNSKEADKIGDLTRVRDQVFIVIEQNGKVGKEGYRKIFKIDLAKADAENRLMKELVVDLNDVKFEFAEKIEGIAVIDEKTFAVVMDNDFGLEGHLNLQTGNVTFTADPHTYLGIIHLANPL